ncbi:hypothetical protein [Solihabitans fulvus]|uniref:hypothetical protein n=1 Tax=Solihabitans fulvus TaxID=1892852 RepID=UPI0016619522|nr:hypothetical protein [Solihabitans fulvus]
MTSATVGDTPRLWFPVEKLYALAQATNVLTQTLAHRRAKQGRLAWSDAEHTALIDDIGSIPPPVRVMNAEERRQWRQVAPAGLADQQSGDEPLTTWSWRLSGSWGLEAHTWEGGERTADGYWLLGSKPELDQVLSYLRSKPTRKSLVDLAGVVPWRTPDELDPDIPIWGQGSVYARIAPTARPMTDKQHQRWRQLSPSLLSAQQRGNEPVTVWTAPVGTAWCVEAHAWMDNERTASGYWVVDTAEEANAVAEFLRRSTQPEHLRFFDYVVANRRRVLEGAEVPAAEAPAQTDSAERPWSSSSSTAAPALQLSRRELADLLYTRMGAASSKLTDCSAWPALVATVNRQLRQAEDPEHALPVMLDLLAETSYVRARKPAAVASALLKDPAILRRQKDGRPGAEQDLDDGLPRNTGEVRDHEQVLRWARSLDPDTPMPFARRVIAGAVGRYGDDVNAILAEKFPGVIDEVLAAMAQGEASVWLGRADRELRHAEHDLAARDEPQTLPREDPAGQADGARELADGVREQAIATAAVTTARTARSASPRRQPRIR